MKKQHFSMDNLEKGNSSMKSRHGYIRLKKQKIRLKKEEDKSKLANKNKCFA